MTERGLHVVQVVCSDGFAGVERHVAGLARTLAERGHVVTVLGGHHTRMPEELGAHAGLAWRAADTVRAATTGLAGLRGVDIVHAHMTEAETAALLARPRHRAPVVSTRHFARPRGTAPLARMGGHLVGRGLAAQVSVSRYVADTIHERSHVILTGVVGPDEVVPGAARSRTVLVVSRLEQEKRVDVALRVWQRCDLAADGWRLVIAGDGACRADLQQQAQALGIAGSCDFLGAREDVPRLLDAAGVLLATCPVEAFGLAVVEAMAHGVPVVATAGGAHSEVLGLTGRPVLFDIADTDAGATLLRDLVTDAVARAEYAAVLRAAQLEWLSGERQGSQVEQLYRAVLRRA